MSKARTMNALERVERLEEHNKILAEQVQILAEEIDNSKEFIMRVVEKLNLTISTFESNGSLSHELVNKTLVKSEAGKLNKKKDDLVKAGILAPSEDDVGDNSFVVGRELSEEKEIVDELVQFSMTSLPEESRSILRGHKKGDLVKIEKSGHYIEITEVYSIKRDLEETQATA